MSQEQVRIELKNFLLDKGVKNKKVAESVGLSDNTISMFLRKTRELSQKKLELIHQYVMENI